MESDATSSEVFIENVLPYVTPGCRVLDLGAGQGAQAERFLQAGAQVVAVEKKAQPSSNPQVDWRVTTIEDYVAHNDTSEQYRIIFLEEVVQFLERRWTLEVLLPWVRRQLQPGGLLAIRTFTREPVPPFPRPCPSHYALSDVQPHFTGWYTLEAREFEHDGQNLRGVSQHFYILNYIVQKPA